MHILIWILIGGLIGWIAAQMLRADQPEEVLLSVGVGIGGALLGGWIISPLLELRTISLHSYNPLSPLASLAGSVLLLAVVHLLRWGFSPQDSKLPKATPVSPPPSPQHFTQSAVFGSPPLNQAAMPPAKMESLGTRLPTDNQPIS